MPIQAHYIVVGWDYIGFFNQYTDAVRMARDTDGHVYNYWGLKLAQGGKTWHGGPALSNLPTSRSKS